MAGLLTKLQKLVLASTFAIACGIAVAEEAMMLAAQKMSVKTKFITRRDAVEG